MLLPRPAGPSTAPCRRPWGLPVLAALLGVACRPDPAPPPPAAPPDVLLVVLDTLRADVLTPYGGQRPISRQLEQVAAAGVVFEDVVAPSIWTWTSHASLFTGVDPWVHGAHADPTGPTGRVTGLLPDQPTLAETFGAAGYRTISLSANCWIGPELGLVRGFDRAECTDNDAEIVRRAQAVMADPDDRPLFLFVNLLTAHAPYLIQDKVPFSARHAAALAPDRAPDWARPFLDPDHGAGLYFQKATPDAPELTGEQAYTLGLFDIPDDGLAMVRDLYDGDVAGVDAALQQLVQAWNGGGHGDGIVAVTSDHGEALGDGHRLGHWGRFGGDVLHVPLVVAAPGRLPAGARVDAPVPLRRLAPTLAALAALPGEHPDSLLPLLDGAPAGDPPVAAFWLNGEHAARDPRLAAGLHLAFRDGARTIVVQGDRVSAYDHRADPAFAHDLADAQGIDRDAWLARARSLADTARSGTPEDRLSPALQEQLRALGYLH